jgi:hypothetical protein
MLKSTLVQVAWAAARTKESHLRVVYLRLKGKRGPKKAIVAVAAEMMRSAWYMLTRDEPYKDIGDGYLRTRPRRSRRRGVSSASSKSWGMPWNYRLRRRTHPRGTDMSFLIVPHGTRRASQEHETGLLARRAAPADYERGSERQPPPSSSVPMCRTGPARPGERGETGPPRRGGVSG